jgi:hypothetical protein
MPLWGNRDLASGNQKPVFANTSPTTSNSTINGTKANTAKYYGNVWGVSATEAAANTTGDGGKMTHAGWVSQKIGTGFVKEVRITSAGSGYNAAADLIFTGGGGSGATGTYTVSSNANAQLNVVTTVSVTNGGSGYTSKPTVTANGSNISAASIEVIMGGKVGRTQYEVLVAMGSITDDNTADNTYFPGT